MSRGGKERAEREVDVAVVGGGVTGLTLGHELATLDRDVLVLEAEERPGGVIRTRRGPGGRVLELGPQRTRLTGAVAELVAELGLEEEVVTAPPDCPLWIYREGRLRRAPLGPMDLLRTELLSPAGKLRLLAEPLTGPPREDESVATALRRRYGEEAYRHFLGPLFGGIYASDPDRMPARHSLVPLWRAFGAPRSFVWSAAVRRARGVERPPACSFRDGLDTLTDALAEACGDGLRLGVRVEEVEPPPDASGRQRLRLGDGGSVGARAVVLTVPAPEAARLLAGREEPAIADLRRLRYNPLALVHLASSMDGKGYGYQISLAEPDFVTRGVTWNASLFGRDDVHTAYLGGMGREEAVGRPDGWLGETAVREFERATGSGARPLAVHRTRMPAHDESWRALDRAREALPPGVHVSANWASQAGIPSRIREARELAGRLDETLNRGGRG